MSLLHNSLYLLLAHLQQVIECHLARHHHLCRVLPDNLHLLLRLLDLLEDLDLAFLLPLAQRELFPFLLLDHNRDVTCQHVRHEKDHDQNQQCGDSEQRLVLVEVELVGNALHVHEHDANGG